MRHLPIALGLLFAAGCTPGVEDANDRDATSQPPAGGPASDALTVGNMPDAQPASVPEQFRGTWAADAAACSTPGHESRLAIGATDVEFHESAGPITAVASGGNQLAVTVQLSGEGDTWSDTYGFELSDDGQALFATDGGLARQRCN